jgi:hypothetical protein
MAAAQPARTGDIGSTKTFARAEIFNCLLYKPI